MDSLKCPFCLISILFVLAASVAGAQTAGQALVGSGTRIIAIDLATGAQTPIPMDDTGLIGILDLAEEASGDLVFADVGGVHRVDLPSGATSELLDTAGGFGIGALAIAPTADVLGTTMNSISGAATVAAIDPTSGTVVEVVDPIPGAFVSQLSGVAADAANNLYLSYSSLLELGPGGPTPYSLIARVPAGSTTPEAIVDSRDAQFQGNTTFDFFAFDGTDTLVASTLGETIYLIDIPTGDVLALSDDGLVTDVRGITFDTNGDVLVLDVANGIVRITNPGGMQTAVPNSVVPDARGIIVYQAVPEPGFAAGLGLAVLGVAVFSKRSA